MIIKPIIPIAYMAVICVALLLLKRKGIWAFLRQLVIVLLLFAINLRPMIPNGEITTKTEKLDANVLFVIDDTISMLATDCGTGKETRLECVREDCRYIISELSVAAFSAMVFHNDPIRLSPFTEDTDYVLSVIDAIQPLSDLYARGSNINTCRPMLLDILKEASKKENGKTIVFFFSDGENTNDDEMESFSDMASMIDYGAVLGYGTEKGGQMYVTDYSGELELLLDYSDWDNYGEAAISKMDEKNLKQLADDMKVTYLPMGKTSRLDSVLQEIRKETAGDTEENDIEGYEDTYYYFAIALLAMIVLEMILYRKKTV